MGEGKPYLVYDNHKSHLVEENAEFIDENFIPLRLPAYSCEFNSIETLWAHLKHKFKLEIVEHLEKIQNPEQLKDMVLKIAQSYPEANVKNILRANSNYIQKYNV